MIKLENISFTYKNKIALDNVNVHIEEGESIAIIGPNGSGKSTFLKLLNAIIFSSKGKYIFDNNEINEHTLKDTKVLKLFHKRLGFVFQNSDAQLFCSTVFEEVAFGRLRRDPAQAHRDGRVGLGLRRSGARDLDLWPGARMRFHIGREGALGGRLDRVGVLSEVLGPARALGDEHGAHHDLRTSTRIDFEQGVARVTLDVRDRSGAFRDDVTPEVSLLAAEGEAEPLAVEHLAPGLFRAEFPIEEYGEFYRLLVVQRQGDEVVDLRALGVTELHSPEFRPPPRTASCSPSSPRRPAAGSIRARTRSGASTSAPARTPKAHLVVVAARGLLPASARHRGTAPRRVAPSPRSPRHSSAATVRAQVDAPARIEAHALALEPRALLGHEPSGIARADAAAGVHDPVPREARPARELSQAASDEPRAPRQAGLERDLPVRRDASARDRVDGREDALARGSRSTGLGLSRIDFRSLAQAGPARACSARAPPSASPA